MRTQRFKTLPCLLATADQATAERSQNERACTPAHINHSQQNHKCSRDNSTISHKKEYDGINQEGLWDDQLGQPQFEENQTQNGDRTKSNAHSIEGRPNGHRIQ